MSVSLAGSVRHPKIYAYTLETYKKTPWAGGRSGAGLIKVGDTQLDVNVRIKHQLDAVKMPVSTKFDVLCVEAAITDEGMTFRDHDVHKALVAAGVHRVKGEWFECTADEVRAAIQAVKMDKPASLGQRLSFPMRPEQKRAVDQTAKYFLKNANQEHPPHYLWNAKMRFGKTFTTYQLGKKLGWTRILVLTYKPAVEIAWRDDIRGHKDFEGWRFKGKDDAIPDLTDPTPLVWFASFQDVLGTDENGNPKLKNESLYSDGLTWDAVVIDEYHFGAWRDAARSIYLGDKESGLEGDKSEAQELSTPDLEDDFVEGIEGSLAQLKVSNYLYLSGTPFRALTEGEFLEDQVFNWTYSDEQRAKSDWQGPDANPYQSLPKMHLLAYEMPEALKEVALNNASEFNLTEFFRAVKLDDGSIGFKHEQEVQKWLGLLCGQDLAGLWANVSSNNRPPLPFEDLNLLTALQHTIWYLPSVDACKAMKNLLEKPHNTFFKEYSVHVAAGSGAGMGDKALPPVRKLIGGVPQDTKTITLSCGKLMTGVTVPAWAGIFMLRELKSPESYFQAAFRVQSPWSYKCVNTEVGGEDEIVVKENCYVIDFSPNRALRQMVDYATRLQAAAKSERNDEVALDEFMEFLPVLSFSGYAMQHLQAGDVIDYLTRGISASMLARRWNSPELLTLDIKSMEAILKNEELLKSLEGIELFRNITEDLKAVISATRELQPKRIADEKLTTSESNKRDEAAKRRDNLRKKLQRFLTRVPAFMYLTDDREKSVVDIIRQAETELFQTVTGLTLRDFEQLMNSGVFNETRMNDAVWKFRQYEEPSLTYGAVSEPVKVRGGWTVRRNERFAQLIDSGTLEPSCILLGLINGVEIRAVVTDDYGINVDGIRHESPDAAAFAATNGQITDGWSFWKLLTAGEQMDSLDSL